MSQFSALCDEFYVNMSLNTEMELPTGATRCCTSLNSFKNSTLRCGIFTVANGVNTSWKKTRIRVHTVGPRSKPSESVPAL